MDPHGNQPAASAAFVWFPLVQRPRPPALPLHDRVRQLRELIARPGDDHSQLIRAAEVCNKAALIASDCGLPDLARTLCWRQHEVFDQARPLSATATKLALQPVLNLPRQLIREGDGAGAYAMLEALYHAARNRTDAVIDGRPVNLRDLTHTPEGHTTICTLAWAALLADGARALLRTGRWRQAAERAAAHRGVGKRLLDGRQVTILALANDGQTDKAAELIEQSTTTELWEQTVQSLLRVACAAGTDPTQHVAAMLTETLALLDDADPTTAVFRTRVGITALNFAKHNDPHLPQLRSELIATGLSNAYAAQDVLAHPMLRQAMTADQRRDLTQLTHSSGLTAGAISEPVYSDLTTTVSLAEDRLRALLSSGLARARGGSPRSRRGC